MKITKPRIAVGLAAGLTLLLVLAAGLISMSSLSTAAAVTEPIIAESTDSEVQSNFAAREAAYVRQVAQLEQLLTDRRSIYATQVEELKSRVNTRQTQIEQLTTQEKAFQQQVDELAGIRNSRLGMYQEQLQAAQGQYDSRLAELSARLSEAQAKLAEANTLLDR
jgi:hypothetical protein